MPSSEIIDEQIQSQSALKLEKGKEGKGQVKTIGSCQRSKTMLDSIYRGL